MTVQTSFDIMDIAQSYVTAGLSILPIQPGSKQPYTRLLPQNSEYKHTWAPYQQRIATTEEIKTWFRQDCGIGVIGGDVSGGLLIIDFESDEAFAQWKENALILVDRAILRSLVVVKTGKGKHVYLRCDSPGGNRKLATREGQTFVETRGEGGYVLAPPTIHPNGQQYTIVYGSLENIPRLPQVHVDALLDAARALSPEQYPINNGQRKGKSVIENFNQHRKIEDILSSNGYKEEKPGRWIRPGGERSSVIVRDGRSCHFNSNDTLYKEAPGGGNYSHDPFSAWCLLEWGGDVKAAVKNASQELGIPAAPSAPPEKLKINEETDFILPGGCRIIEGCIHRGEYMLYMGVIYVAETGTDPFNQTENALVRWHSRGYTGETIIPRNELASQGGCTRWLAGAGAAIHAMNAKHISRYLVEFIQMNNKLPHKKYIDRYGIIGDSLMLPSGMVGNQEEETRYTGTPIQVGTDHTIYHETLRQAVGWNSTTMWGVLGIALSSPIYANLKPERNPVVHLGGSSGSGKTTIVQFALGTFGDATSNNMQVQCGSGSTTAKGMAETLVQANGLPVFFEDVHMMMERDPKRVAGVIYDFANGQDRTYSTRDHKRGGGKEIHGSLAMAGEQQMIFQHAGSNNRVLSFNCDRFPPLGVARASNDGLERARLLRAAWGAGAGSLGYQVMEHIWSNWSRYKLDVMSFEQDKALEPLQAWRRLLAIAAATLQVVANIVDLPIDIDNLLKNWSTIYQAGVKENDPAAEAFERIRMMLTQSVYRNNRKDGYIPTWHYLYYERKLVATRREGEDDWRVMTTSPEWKKLVGENAVEQFGLNWMERGWVTAHKNGRVSAPTYVGRGSTPYCILVTPEGYGYSTERGGHDHAN